MLSFPNWIAQTLLIVVVAPISTAAQSAQPTSNILFRVLMVRTNSETGTMFSIDVDNREYWLTAKHLLTGAKHPPIGNVESKKVSLSVLDPTVEEETWNKHDFNVLDPGRDIDIVVLAAEHPLQQISIPTLPVSSDAAPVGGECTFLGFPFANTWMATFDNGARYRMPYIKHCYMSGFIMTPIKVWVLDGINNDGFSGGPVVFLTGPQQKILAVVSSFVSEASDVLSVPVLGPSQNKKPTSSKSKPDDGGKRKNVVNQNAGIILATDASYAIEVIKKNPIGPVIEKK